MTAPTTEAESIGTPACAACGGIGAWTAARQDVVCQSCGQVIVLPTPPAGPFERFALLPLLRDRPDSGRDWQPRATHLRCRSCHALIACDAHVVGRTCEACGTPGLVPIDATGAPVAPSAVLPFRTNEADARATLNEWLTSRARRVTVDAVRALYVPCWIFDASVQCRWRGEIRKEGEPPRGIDGMVEETFDNYTIPASASLTAPRLKAIEPFPTEEMRPYDARYLAGYTVEVYSKNMWDAWDAASGRMQQELNAQLRRDSDCSPDELETWPEWSHQRGAQVLVPIYLMQCRDGKKPFDVTVNGWSGSVGGTPPVNWPATLAVLGTLLAIAAALAYGVVSFLS